VLGATAGIWDVPTVDAAVEGLVGPVLRRGEAERAALLLGAVSALLHGTGASRAPQAAPVAAAARAEIGDPAFELAFAEGAGLSREQALALIAAG
jgi:hypothetical protein